MVDAARCGGVSAKEDGIAKAVNAGERIASQSPVVASDKSALHKHRNLRSTDEDQPLIAGAVHTDRAREGRPMATRSTPTTLRTPVKQFR